MSSLSARRKSLDVGSSDVTIRSRFHNGVDGFRPLVDPQNTRVVASPARLDAPQTDLCRPSRRGGFHSFRLPVGMHSIKQHGTNRSMTVVGRIEHDTLEGIGEVGGFVSIDVLGIEQRWGGDGCLFLVTDVRKAGI